MKKQHILEVLKQELRFCKSELGKNDTARQKEYLKGFTAGIKQAIFLVNQIPKSDD